MKRDAAACAFVFVSNFLQYVSAKNWQNWMTSDSAITNIKGDVSFPRHSVALKNNYKRHTTQHK